MRHDATVRPARRPHRDLATTLGHLTTNPDVDTRIAPGDVFVDVRVQSAVQIQEWGIGIGFPVIKSSPVRQYGEFV